MTLRALGIEHDVHVVDLLTGAQKKPEFLKINPRGTVPAIVDDGLHMSESKAIMMYLINQYGQGFKKDLYPKDPAVRGKIDQMLYVAGSVETAVQTYPAL